VVCGGTRGATRENVLALVKEHRLEPAQQILEQVMDGVQTARGAVPQEDDMTAVICKVDGGP